MEGGRKFAGITPIYCIVKLIIDAVLQILYLFSVDISQSSTPVTSILGSQYNNNLRDIDEVRVTS